MIFIFIHIFRCLYKFDCGLVVQHKDEIDISTDVICQYCSEMMITPPVSYIVHCQNYKIGTKLNIFTSSVSGDNFFSNQQMFYMSNIG